MRTLALLVLFAMAAFARMEFWAPAAPPRAQYSIDVQVASGDAQRLQGTESIRFRNTTQRPIGRILFRWFGDISSVRANGVAAERAPGKNPVPLFDLPRDIQPGGEVELLVEFSAPWKLDPRTGSAITSFLSPRLWWGFGTLDDYVVRLKVPEGYTVGTSGRLDPATGLYKATGIRSFGLFVGKGYESAEADAGEVRIRTVFIKEARPCAELLLKTAVDAVQWYRERFGLYPHSSLTIVPGMDYPAGGYAPASALAVVHGQHRFPERSEGFWRWITAHEIGHMYWGEHVLAQGTDSLSWLLLGLGIHADREYRQARGIKDAGRLESNYVNGVLQGRDTTMDVTSEQKSAIEWNFNNIVEHGKSAAMVNALESVIGAETYWSLYRRCLREYAGRQLGWRDFQRAAERESGQDLNWFFEQWVRSSESAAYRIAAKECTRAGDAFDCRVQIERTGGMRMPITVAARFDDGSEQRARTERLADTDEIRFRARTALKDVAIEPEGAVALAEAPLTRMKLLSQIRQAPWTGAGAAALQMYKHAGLLTPEDIGTRGKLAFLLYDDKHYRESLELMSQLEKSDWRFVSLVWQGHLLDLLGRRDEAIDRYREALKVEGSPTVRHDQYNMRIDKRWLEERIKVPFAR